MAITHISKQRAMMGGRLYVSALGYVFGVPADRKIDFNLDVCCTDGGYAATCLPGETCAEALARLRASMNERDTWSYSY